MTQDNKFKESFKLFIFFNAYSKILLYKYEENSKSKVNINKDRNRLEIYVIILFSRLDSSDLVLKKATSSF